MANFGENHEMTFQANGDLSSSQWKIVEQTTTNGQVQTPASSGNPAIGVLQNTPSSAGQSANVRVNGVAKVEAGSAFSYDDALKVNGSGQAVSTDPTTTTTSHYVLGRAVGSPSGSGELTSMLITHGGQIQ